MEEQNIDMEPLIKHIEAYSESGIELLKLKIIDKTVSVVSDFYSRTFVFICILACFLVGTIGAALWLGEYLGKIYYGFFVVSGCYALLGLILYFFAHEWIKRRIASSIIYQIFN